MKYFTNWSEYKDASGKKGLKDDPEKMNQFVRNIYKVLMTRGKKVTVSYLTQSYLTTAKKSCTLFL